MISVCVLLLLIILFSCFNVADPGIKFQFPEDFDDEVATIIDSS